MSFIPTTQKQIVHVILFIIATCNLAVAQDGGSGIRNERLTVESLVAWVLQENPGIHELKAALENAQYRVEPQRSLDDPTFSYAFAPNTFGREGQGLNQKFELSQAIPWPGTLAAREEAARSEIDVAKADIAVLRLHLIDATRAAYAEWYFVERQLAIHHASQEFLTELHRVAETRYASGTALQQDVLQVEVEQSKLERHGLALQRRQLSIQAQINALLNRESSAPLPRVSILPLPALPLPLESLEQQAVEHHPELHRLNAQITATEAQVTLAEKAFNPNFKLSAGYNSLWDEVDKRLTLGVSVNVPFGRGQRKASLNEAEANVRRLTWRLTERRAQLLSQLAQARADAVESFQAIKLFEQSLLPLSIEFLDAAMADYQSGSGSFSSVITAEQTKLSTEEEYERVRADYFRRMSDLDRWSGAGKQYVAANEWEGEIQ